MISSHDSIRVVHGVDALDRAQDGLQVARVGELELEPHLGHAVCTSERVARNDVDVFIGECIGHVAQQSRAVERDHLDCRGVRGDVVGSDPRNLDHATGQL